MGIVLGAQNLEKSFGARPLFSGVSFGVEAAERIGLIGPNGAGKSTLLKILAGRLSSDAGTLSVQRGLRIGYLDQMPTFHPEGTIESAVRDGEPDDAGWEQATRAELWMSRLGLLDDGRDPTTPVAALSGGWRKRVALARELMREPDLLLLDEPTNHLDVEGIEWLESLLATSSFATVTITHDRVFLQRVTNRILELDRRHPGGLLSVKGDYLRYLEVRAETLAAQERREVVLKNTLRRETEWLRRGPPARSTKQEARIQRAGSLAAEVDELKIRNQDRLADLEFRGAEKSPKRLVEAKGISKAYGDLTILRNETVLVTPGTRLGLLGPNGCGKSTLIRLLVGTELPDSGTVTRADSLLVSYFQQDRSTLVPERTVADTLCPAGDYVEYGGSRVHVRGYLDRFLFSSEQTDMQVGKLSGGEQSRLLIALLMLQKANLLVLDEPTNDLDTATLAVLEDCLTTFAGAVLLVTHDRYFLDQVATQILAFPTGTGRGGPLERFSDVNQWERWHKAQNVPAKRRSRDDSSLQPEGARSKKRKVSYKEQREWDGMEAAILLAEETLARQQAALADPSHGSNGAKLIELSGQVAAAQKEVDRLYARWAELEPVFTSAVDQSTKS